MSFRVFVVEPPDPVVTPADVPGDHAADDADVTAWIAAATAEIDGPAGWLGRAIGAQTLELRSNEFWPCGRPFKLPYPPVIEIVSLIYINESDVEITIAAADYALAGQRFYAKPTFTSPTIGPDYDGVRLRYRAGYDGGAAGSPFGTTGDVPAPIKQWIINRAMQLRAMLGRDPLVRSESTEGIDSVTYVMQDAVMAGTGGLDVLLSPYQVYS
jgi:hypothetical protein